MTPKQRYDDIINFIENEIDKGLNSKPSNIIEQIKKEFYIDERALGQIFNFMTNLPINAYIKQRQLMKAANVILNDLNKDPIAYTGCSDAPTFIKAFSREFGVSPSKLQNLDRPTEKIKPASTWDYISQIKEKTNTKPQELKKYSADPQKVTNNIETENNTEKTGETNMVNKMKFGISIDTYEKIIEAEKMQNMYGFDDEISNLAYQISEKYSSSLKKSFEFMDDFLLQSEYKKAHIRNFNLLSKDFDDIIWLSLNLDLSYCQAKELLKELKVLDIEDVKKESKNVLSLYIKSSYDYDLIEYWWKLYTTVDNDLGAKDFEDFVSIIGDFESYEDACDFYSSLDYDFFAYSHYNESIDNDCDCSLTADYAFPFSESYDE